MDDKQQRIQRLKDSLPIIATGNEHVGLYELNNKSAEKYIRQHLRFMYHVKGAALLKCVSSRFQYIFQCTAYLMSGYGLCILWIDDPVSLFEIRRIDRYCIKRGG